MKTAPTGWIFFDVIAVIAFFLRLCYLVFPRSVVNIPPYRRVINRMPATDGGGGEIVTLECQHSYRILHHQRVELPCELCREEAEKK